MKQYFPISGGGLVRAVDDVSFSIQRGEVFGLVGESGCGKTTTGRAIIKLYELTGGDVWFDGAHISTGEEDRLAQLRAARKAGDRALAARLEAELRQARKEVRAVELRTVMAKMQMIFQDPIASLDPRMTVREIVAEGLRIRGVRDKAILQDKVRQALERVGLLPEHMERYPHEFSGGQRQRIGVARAMILEPSLIIADEPVSALDVSIQAQVINLLNELRRDFGLTILFIAHDLSVVKYFSDRIAVMYYGRIVELAESDELFRNPLHPYTRALLSAIPLPDPHYEKHRKRILYVPGRDHDYSREEPSFQEVFPGHFVRCNGAELARYRA